MQEPVIQLHQYSHRFDHRGRRQAMAGKALGSIDPDGLGTFPENLIERLQLCSIARDGAGGVSIDIVNIARIQSGIMQRQAHGANLAVN